jgi:hypothetical protein
MLFSEQFTPIFFRDLKSISAHNNAGSGSAPSISNDFLF